jgi:hypothetical protein
VGHCQDSGNDEFPNDNQLPAEKSSLKIHPSSEVR